MLTKFYRYQQGLKALANVVLFSLAYYLAFAFRFNFIIPESQWRLFLASLPLLILIKLIVFWRARQFRASWRFVGSRDMVSLAKAAVISSLLCILVIYTVWMHAGFSRSILILDFILTIFLVAGARFSSRILRESRVEKQREHEENVVIVGAGDAGESLLREIHKNPQLSYEVKAIFDDHPSKIGISIHNVPVKGPIEHIPEFVATHEVKHIFIAMPSATGNQMRRIVDICRKTDCEVKTIPGLGCIMGGRVTVSQLRKVAIEDILGREPVELDTSAIEQYLQNKTVLVTGAAGSIGSEICRQVLRFNPRKLLLFDQAETGLFEIYNELIAHEEKRNCELVHYIGDICDAKRVELVMSQHKPEVVFHAAAYKHVPMMEDHPSEAVKNNVLGTKILADLAQAHGVSRFVFISTDKAVNPTSIMGTTKRIAELYLQQKNSQNGTRFIMVRFGNVLDSAGSVIPIFRRQIAAGGPVTVTHPEMTRYFMTIPEASQLVLQAASMGEGGEIFILDMGEQVKIIDLARDMISLSGFKPEEEIPIVFTGIRPGEKLYEELWHQDDIEPTKHKKIYIMIIGKIPPNDFNIQLDYLIHNYYNCKDEQIKNFLV